MAGSNRPVASTFLAEISQVVASIAAGASLKETLDQLVRLTEGHIPGSTPAVWLLDEDREHLRLAASSDGPISDSASVEDSPVKSETNPCAATVVARAETIVADITLDERWAKWRAIALERNLRACWCMPVLSQMGDALGVFVLYYSKTRQPREGELDILRVAAHLASLTIEKRGHGKSPESAGGQWRAMFDQSLDAILVADDQRRFVDANQAACDLLDAPREKIVGALVNEFMVPDRVGKAQGDESRWAAFLQTGQCSDEFVILRPDGSRRYADVRARANFLPGLHLCAVHDTTERKLQGEAVRTAEKLYRTLFETTDTGYLVSDANGWVLDANAEYVRLTGLDSLEAIRGRSPLDWTAPADRQHHASGIARCLREGAVRDLVVRFSRGSGPGVPVEINATALAAEDGVHLLSLCRDVTLREESRQEIQTARLELESRVRRRTAELALANDQIQSRARQQEAVAEIGRRALTGEDLDRLMHNAAEVAARMLDVDFSAVVEHADPESDQLLLRACHGWAGELDKPFATSAPDTLMGYSLLSREPVVIEDLHTESRFQPLAVMREAGVVSGITVKITGEERPFGLIAAHSARPRKFTVDDIHFLQSVANVLAAAVARKRAEQTARVAREAAVSANDAKIEFLSRMSHELRTPLNAILGFSQLLEIDVLSAGQLESVEQIIRAGRHLLQLVNEVLDISRIDSGNFALSIEPIGVGELLGEAVDLIRPLADARKITLIAPDEVLSGRDHVLADRQRLRQVLINLLSNAVKYNRPAGEVRLRSGPAPDGRGLRIQVTDTGAGIPPEKLSRLFTPFDRLGAEGTQVEGSGMGLALSKRLIEAQGGHLGMDNAVGGSGCTFWVDLAVAAAPPRETSPGFLDVLSEPLLIEEYWPWAKSDHPAPAPAEMCQTILYIEDNEPNRRLVELLLTQRPRVRLISAARGYEGVDLARKHRPDLILLDMHLPDISGEQVLNALRNDERTRETAVVVVSADATAIRQASLKACGASDYVTKPFDVNKFLRVIDEQLRKKTDTASSPAPAP